MIRALAFLEAESLTGPAKNLLEFGRQLQSLAKPEVALEIAAFHRGPAANAFTEAAEAARIPLHRIAERAAFDRAVLPRLAEIVAQVQPEILQTHALKSHFLVRLAGHWRRRPWVAFHHGYTATSARMHLYNQLDRWSLRKPALAVTVSEAFREQLEERGVPEHRIRVLHNAIDPTWGDRVSEVEFRQQARVKLGIGGDEFVLLIVGRLSQEKAHTVLVEAMARLRPLVVQPARLVILGDGPERAAIASKAAECGVSDRVQFAGHANDVTPYYGAADAAVLSSKTEGSPNALLEAMAARVPVVATDVGGIPEIVTHKESALLVPPMDVDAMTAALGEIMQSPELRQSLALRARRLIEERYTPETRMQRLCQIYSEAKALFHA